MSVAPGLLALGAVAGWLVLLVLLLRALAPERSVAQIIRDVESSR